MARVASAAVATEPTAHPLETGSPRAGFFCPLLNRVQRQTRRQHPASDHSSPANQRRANYLTSLTQSGRAGSIAPHGRRLIPSRARVRNSHRFHAPSASPHGCWICGRFNSPDSTIQEAFHPQKIAGGRQCESNGTAVRQPRFERRSHAYSHVIHACERGANASASVAQRILRAGRRRETLLPALEADFLRVFRRCWSR